MMNCDQPWRALWVNKGFLSDWIRRSGRSFDISRLFASHRSFGDQGQRHVHIKELDVHVIDAEPLEPRGMFRDVVSGGLFV